MFFDTSLFVNFQHNINLHFLHKDFKIIFTFLHSSYFTFFSFHSTPKILITWFTVNVEGARFDSSNIAIADINQQHVQCQRKGPCSQFSEAVEF